MLAIIRGVNDSDVAGARGDDASSDRSDPRLSEARRVLEDLKEAEGVDALASAGRLADVLEELLEGREGERN